MSSKSFFSQLVGGHRGFLFFNGLKRSINAIFCWDVGIQWGYIQGTTDSPLGKFQLSTIAKVDQTPLSFTFNSGQGYNKTGEKTVWHRGADSGLDKRECTVQLSIFGDGEACVPPLLIFRGKGLRISQAEKAKYDRRVRMQWRLDAAIGWTTCGNAHLAQCWNADCRCAQVNNSLSSVSPRSHSDNECWWLHFCCRQSAQIPHTSRIPASLHLYSSTLLTRQRQPKW